MTATPRTRYSVEVSCDDLGEYDAMFMAAFVGAAAELLGAAGVHDFQIVSVRKRPGEFS